MSLLVPTPPASPKPFVDVAAVVGGGEDSGPASAASTPSSRGSRQGGSSNAARRRTMLVESDLNAALKHAATKQDGTVAAAAPIVPLEPQRPQELPVAASDSASAGGLPVSAPISLKHAVSPRPRSRQNSWVEGEDMAAAAAAVAGSSAPSALSEVTAVEPVDPSQIASSPVAPAASEAVEPKPTPAAATASPARVPGGGAHPMFASAEAAEKYQRLLRRASWPLILPQPELIDAGINGAAAVQPSAPHAAPVSQLSIPTANEPGAYTATPQHTPRRLALRARQNTFPAQPQPPVSTSTDDPSFADASASDAALMDAASSSVASDAQSPLVNLLLLGDSTCGLGVALDEFAGRDRQVGVTFKTRRIHLRASKVGERPSRPEQLVRVRCWYTADLTPENCGNIAPYLRRVQAVALVYDASSMASFRVCEAWSALLMAHAQAAQAAGTPQRRPLLLVANTANLRPGLVHAAHAVHHQPPPMVDYRVAEASQLEPAVLAAAAASGSAGTSPALSRRRASLPHGHMPHASNGAVPAVPIAGVTGLAPAAMASRSSSNGSTSDNGGSGSEHGDSPPSAPTGGGGGGLVSSAAVLSLLTRLSAPSACLGGEDGLVLARSVDACAWKERFVLFYTVAALAANLNQKADDSRPVSPVHT